MPCLGCDLKVHIVTPIKQAAMEHGTTRQTRHCRVCGMRENPQNPLMMADSTTTHPGIGCSFYILTAQHLAPHMRSILW